MLISPHKREVFHFKKATMDLEQTQLPPRKTVSLEQCNHCKFVFDHVVVVNGQANIITELYLKLTKSTNE